MKFVQRYKAYPQLTLCSLLLVFLGLFGGIMYQQNNAQNQHERIQLYGAALASGAARQAVTPAIAQDLVSMQAVLTELSLHQYVLGASIHNVENLLLVQSGFKPNHITQGDRLSFSAPVALHNNIYGYLEVVLDVPRHSARDYRFYLFWVAAIFCCLFIIGWSIYRHWWRELKDKIPSAGELVTAVVEKIPTIEPIPEPPPEAPKQVSVRLSLHICNLERLYLQLNSEGFATVLRRFDTQLQSLLNLYGGQRQMLAGDTLLIDFTGESYVECAFRALCFAHLSNNQAAANPSPRLQLASAIQELSEPTQAKQSLLRDFVVQHNNHLKPEKGEILLSQRLIDEELLEHVELVVDSGKFIAIKPPYAELVARQEQQLNTKPTSH